MALNLANLDPATRQQMVSEINNDRASHTLYISPRLTTIGQAAWPDLLVDAVQSHDDTWLATQLRAQSLIAGTEQRKKPTGGFSEVKVPVTAPDTLSEGEFNRFYMRGLAQVAINNGTTLTVYRAKEVANPRRESELKIGQSVDPKALLNDLRNNVGLDTVLGLPSGPNSGLSVKL